MAIPQRAATFAQPCGERSGLLELASNMIDPMRVFSAKPTRLIAKNFPISWGLVFGECLNTHRLLKKKLLITATTKESDLKRAYRGESFAESPKEIINRLKIPKSRMVLRTPIAPNRRKMSIIVL